MRYRIGFESQVAMRFLREGRMQTVLIIVGVAAGVAVVAYISALISGLQRNTLEKTLGAQAHITISAPEDTAFTTSPNAANNVTLQQVQPRTQRPRAIVNWHSKCLESPQQRTAPHRRILSGGADGAAHVEPTTRASSAPSRTGARSRTGHGRQRLESCQTSQAPPPQKAVPDRCKKTGPRVPQAVPDRAQAAAVSGQTPDRRQRCIPGQPAASKNVYGTTRSDRLERLQPGTAARQVRSQSRRQIPCRLFNRRPDRRSADHRSQRRGSPVLGASQTIRRRVCQSQTSPQEASRHERHTHLPPDRPRVHAALDAAHSAQKFHAATCLRRLSRTEAGGVPETKPRAARSPATDQPDESPPRQPKFLHKAKKQRARSVRTAIQLWS